MSNKILRHFTLLVLTFLITSCQSVAPKKVVVPKEKVEVAILLPLSGPLATQVNQLVKLIRLGIQDGLGNNINVTEYDVYDETSMDKIITKNTKIILGPLFSDNVTNITTKALQHDILVVSLSNNPTIVNENVFVFGHPPLVQTERLINYLLDEGFVNFVLLLPQNDYSYNLIKIVEVLANKKNGIVAKTELYGDNTESINLAVSKVTKVVDNLNESEMNLTKPVIFVADDIRKLPNLLNSVSKHNLDKKAVVCGDNRIAMGVQDINLMFTGSLNYDSSSMRSKFKELFKVDRLNFLDKLAYDLGLVVSHSIGNEFNKEVFLSKLQDDSGYIGIAGTMRFNKHIAERIYDIIACSNDVCRVVQKAQESF